MYYDDSIFAGVMAFIGVILIIVLLFSIFSLIGQWKIFKKAGKEPWYCLIPIYNLVVLCQIAGVSPYWLFVVFLGGIIPVIGGFISTIGGIYFYILLWVSLSRSFSKDDSFAIGLYFLSPIFLFILGNSSNEYVGPKPMNDIIFKNSGTGNTSSTSNTTYTNTTNTGYNNFDPNTGAPINNGGASAPSFCNQCGTKLTPGAQYCAGCGNRIF